ncbi:MAG: diguanylate cyclase [Burkholderiaceae bacterium]|nr:diguanylate cyclase [Burkholderiaceae bacterium]
MTPLAATQGADDRVGAIERLVEAIDLPIGRWDARHRLTFCNTPYVNWAARPREQLLGRTLEEIYGPAAWNAAREAFGKAFAGATVSYERLLTHRGGPPRWARVQVFPGMDSAGRVEAVYTIAFDIHDDVTAREALEAARRRLDRFTENIPYPLTYVDRDFRICFVNRAYMEATGMTSEQLIGRHIGEVRGARRWAEHRPYFERALAGETVHYARLTELANLGPRWVRTTYSPDFDEAGRVIGIYTSTVDVHELTLARQALERSVERDALTDVLSRRALMDRIDRAVARCATDPIALFFVDIDGFKGVNDALGHRAGDVVLAAVATALTRAVRAEDTVGRFGGDEFIVLARLADRAAAAALAAHLLDAVRRAPCGTHIGASIGYALAPADADTSFELVRQADDAMYAAKRLGGGRAMHCAEPRSR